MRLLHTTKLELTSYITNIPPYAILSHTWGSDEVLFEDIADASARVNKSGWEKVLSCCQRAAKDGWEYVWIDTCCINKSDPTELGEAINSMFRWYEKAEVCYAYLSDVPAPTALDNNRSDQAPWRWYFMRSRWFTRGWTLQELLAPSFLLFIDQSWGTIGPREEWSLEIAAVTGIERKQLFDFKTCCIATKLSWAANRETTREEDRAYSLLGLLGIYMPLIYGEGKSAFIRLQHELIRTSTDETIFVWNSSEPSSDILAPTLDAFSGSNGLTTRQFDQERRGFVFTNAGLSLNAEIFECHEIHRFEGLWYAIQLNCAWAWPPIEATMKPVVLFLKKDPIKSVSLKGVPVFFQRFGDQTKHWGQVGFAMKQSLGRHDIIITRPEESVNQTCVTRFVVTPRCDRKTQLGDIHRFHWRSDKESWTPADSKSHGKSYDGGDVKIFKNQAVIWELQVEEDDATIAKKFLILIKWTPRLLMVGVLKRSSLDPESLEQVSSMLNSSSQRPYTNSAKVSLHRCLRASSMPKPTGDQIGGKAIFLDISIIAEPVENFDIPVVAYGSKEQEEEDHGAVEAELSGLERDHDFAHQLVHVPDPESIFIDTPD